MALTDTGVFGDDGNLIGRSLLYIVDSGGGLTVRDIRFETGTDHENSTVLRNITAVSLRVY